MVILALILILPCILGPVILGGMFFFWQAVEREPKFIDIPIERPAPEPTLHAAQSTLYEKFNPTALKEKYFSNFHNDKFESTVEGIKIIDTGDIYKAVELQGVISDDEFEKVFFVLY